MLVLGLQKQEPCSALQIILYTLKNNKVASTLKDYISNRYLLVVSSLYIFVTLG